MHTEETQTQNTAETRGMQKFQFSRPEKWLFSFSILSLSVVMLGLLFLLTGSQKYVEAVFVGPQYFAVYLTTGEIYVSREVVQTPTTLSLKNAYYVAQTQEGAAATATSTKSLKLAVKPLKGWYTVVPVGQLSSQRGTTDALRIDRGEILFSGALDRTSQLVAVIKKLESKK